MKKYFKIIIFAVFGASAVGCSSDNDNPAPTPNPPTEDDGVSLANVKFLLVDKNATPETVALFYNLKKSSAEKFLLGQQDPFHSFYNNGGGDSDFKKVTGSDPAIAGEDFMFITDEENDGTAGNWWFQQEQQIIADAKKAYNMGAAVTFCWHFRGEFTKAPSGQNSFYVDTGGNDNTKISIEQAKNAVPSILPGGANYEYFKGKLDHIALILNNLKGADGKLIPVIFRPFHEFDGNWFWWGAPYCSAENYQQLYRFAVTYLRDTKGVHNVLYAFAPDCSYSNSSSYLQRYPGDSFVDILAIDDYNDFANQNSSGMNTANSKLKMISDMAFERKKIAALSETGYASTNQTSMNANFFTTILYPALTSNDIKIAYALFWYNYQNTWYVPPTSAPQAADFKNFAKKNEVVLQNNLPQDLYKLPSK